MGVMFLSFKVSRIRVLGFASGAFLCAAVNEMAKISKIKNLFKEDYQRYQIAKHNLREVINQQKSQISLFEQFKRLSVVDKTSADNLEREFIKRYVSLKAYD